MPACGPATVLNAHPREVQPTTFQCKTKHTEYTSIYHTIQLTQIIYHSGMSYAIQ